MTYTRIDIIGGEECRVEFETLRQAVADEPRHDDAVIRRNSVCIATADPNLMWASTSSASLDERPTIDGDPVDALRTSLAEALGLTDPSDDELVQAVQAEKDAHLDTLTTLECERSDAHHGPMLTDAPLPEGHEGESIVVACMTGNTGAVALARWSSSTLEMEGWHTADDFFHAGLAGYRWAYVTRVE